MTQKRFASHNAFLLKIGRGLGCVDSAPSHPYTGIKKMNEFQYLN